MLSSYPLAVYEVVVDVVEIGGTVRAYHQHRSAEHILSVVLTEACVYALYEVYTASIKGKDNQLGCTSKAGFSPEVNILTLAAYERARRALRGECEPNSRAGKMRTNISNEPSANTVKMREVGSRPRRLRQNKKDRQKNGLFGRRGG